MIIVVSYRGISTVMPLTVSVTDRYYPKTVRTPLTVTVSIHLNLG